MLKKPSNNKYYIHPEGWKFALIFFIASYLISFLYIHQKRLINNDQYLDAFKFNNWIGMFASIGFVIEAFLI